MRQLYIYEIIITYERWLNSEPYPARTCLEYSIVYVYSIFKFHPHKHFTGVTQYCGVHVYATDDEWLNYIEMGLPI